MWTRLFEESPEFVKNSPHLAQLYYNRVLETGMIRRKITIGKRRVQLSPLEISEKEKQIYEDLLKDPTIDQQIGRLQSETRLVSGRILDSLVTKYPNVADTNYYLVDGKFSALKPATGDFEQVDLCESYKSHIKKYTKACFDPFGRGHDILHVTKSGQVIPFSLRRFMFHRWAERYGVYDFLAHHFDEVASLQRKGQQQARMQKKSSRKSAQDESSPRRPKKAKA